VRQVRATTSATCSRLESTHTTCVCLLVALLGFLQPGEAGARYDISHLQRLKDMAVKNTTGAQMALESTGRSLDVCSKRMIRV
jgi:hypothetical protein